MTDSQGTPPTQSRAAGRGAFVRGIKDVLPHLANHPTIGWTTLSFRDEAVVLQDPFRPYTDEVETMLKRLGYN